MISISDVHLAIAFTLPPKHLIHVNIKHSLSRVQVRLNHLDTLSAINRHSPYSNRVTLIALALAKIGLALLLWLKARHRYLLAYLTIPHIYLHAVVLIQLNHSRE